MKLKSELKRLKYSIHPRPNPIAAALYTLRDLGCDVIVLHGPSGCNFRALRLLERDGIKVFTTSLNDMDVVMGGKNKLIEVLEVVCELFNPKLLGVIGSCCTSIIGEDIESEVREANLPVKIVAANVSACIGDNVEGALKVLEASVKVGVIDQREYERQKVILKKAAEVEKLRGVALPGYIEPSEGDDVDEVAKTILDELSEHRRIAVILNAKKETAYLYSDIMLAIKEVLDYTRVKANVTFIANLMQDRGLPKVRADASTILRELNERGIKINHFTGGLDEYALTNEAIQELVERIGGFDLSIILGVPQAIDVNHLGKAIGVSSGNRTMSRLRSLGYFKVVNEEGAHVSVLGSRRIVKSELGEAIRREVKRS
ncbi:MAG: Ni-sirohydrochlorin a,c-diamide reductive cyclase catalytic subunit [Candidatus Nezhaarchaeota archaeon]|nr:Ni-sirohydrochlorin a,c-diamide reductive cyclase catalytic subunit [Candidatus Nezhaarchaeota archaeon]MCX8141204.1 Ni-sirohydrochlorin a,c-diamide reductive cyclase catalytic subunit [Candidatus Nezhaarchaeota archaeon]MDW8049470.1 Ni-sirohydrochlorin a,c-diamide reductive cyclase catalytic subunit [Nitrososphaerota archaeon]